MTFQSMWVDDIQVELAKLIDANVRNLAIATDSIGALELFKIVSDGVSKGDVKADQGRLQKEIKKMLKMIVHLVKFQDCVAFSAGHYYGNPTGYGAPEKIGGGNYFRLSCDTIISLKWTPMYENPQAKGEARGRILGNQITAATLKNRLYPPFQEANIQVDFKNGVNSMAGLIDLAEDLKVIEKSGSWYSFKDVKVQGQAVLTTAIMEKYKDTFLEEIELKLKETGYSNVNHELKELVKEVEETEPINEEPPNNFKFKLKKNNKF